MKRYLFISLVINMLIVGYVQADVVAKDANTMTVTTSQDVSINTLMVRLKNLKDAETDIQNQIDEAAQAGVVNAIPLASANVQQQISSGKK